MQFNCDKTEEVIFSVKRPKTEHPSLKLGLDEVARKDEHKHLGLILDSKLNFKSHIRQAILKARRGIGMIKYLSKYVSRDVLDQVLIRSTSYTFARIWIMAILFITDTILK